MCGPFLEIHAEPCNPKVRARPASAQPFSRAPTTTTSSNNAVGGSSRRRKEYWPRHLPPPWDEHSNNGDCSSRSGSAGGGDDDGGDGYCRRRGSRPASSGKRARVPTAAVGAAAAANLELRTRMGAQSKWWDGSCAVGMDVAARRALAARVAAAAVEAGEVRRTTSARGFGFNEGAFNLCCRTVLSCYLLRRNKHYLTQLYSSPSRSSNPDCRLSIEILYLASRYCGGGRSVQYIVYLDLYFGWYMRCFVVRVCEGSKSMIAFTLRQIRTHISSLHVGISRQIGL